MRVRRKGKLWRNAAVTFRKSLRFDREGPGNRFRSLFRAEKVSRLMIDRIRRDGNWGKGDFPTNIQGLVKSKDLIGSRYRKIKRKNYLDYLRGLIFGF